MKFLFKGGLFFLTILAIAFVFMCGDYAKAQYCTSGSDCSYLAGSCVPAVSATCSSVGYGGFYNINGHCGIVEECNPPITYLGYLTQAECSSNQCVALPTPNPCSFVITQGWTFDFPVDCSSGSSGNGSGSGTTYYSCNSGSCSADNSCNGYGGPGSCDTSSTCSNVCGSGNNGGTTYYSCNSGSCSADNSCTGYGGPGHCDTSSTCNYQCAGVVTLYGTNSGSNTPTAGSVTVNYGGTSTLTWDIPSGYGLCNLTSDHGDQDPYGNLQVYTSYDTQPIDNSPTVYTLGCSNLNYTAPEIYSQLTIYNTATTFPCTTPGPGANQLVGCLYNDSDGSTLTNQYGNAPAQATASGNADNFTAINTNWNAGGPATSNGSYPTLDDNWSARWQGTFNFSGGTYQFTAGSDDGDNLYVDGLHITGDWNPRGYATNTASVSLGAGQHIIKYEYFQDGGGDQAYLNWSQTASSTIPTAVLYGTNTGGVTPTASSVMVSFGGTSNLTWTTANVSSCSLSNNQNPDSVADAIATTSHTTAPIAAQTTYTLNCSSASGPVSSSLVINTITAASLTPSSGSSEVASSTSFTQVYTDTAGAGDITQVWTFLRSSYAANPTNNACYLRYDSATNSLFLLNDSGSAWSTGSVIGSGASLSNSQCTANVSASSVSRSGSNLTLILNYTFLSPFVGPQQFWMTANDATAGSGWQQTGTWTVDGPPNIVLETPAANSTVSGLINIKGYIAPSASASITRAQLWIASSSTLISDSAISPSFYPVNDSASGCSSNCGFIYGNFDTTTLVNGPHTITITAFDSLGNQYSLNTNITVNNVAQSPTAPTGGSVYNSGSSNPPGGTVSCGQVQITWTDNSTNETGFKIYMDGVYQTTVPASSPPSQTGEVLTYNFTPPDNNPHSYSVAATNGNGTSAQVAETGNPYSSVACTAVMTDSSKNIVAISGNAISPVPSQCNGFAALPSGTNLNLGDTLSFRIDLCNDQGQATATKLSLTDSMLNLSVPNAGWNVKYNGTALIQVGSNPASGQYSLTGTAPNQTLSVNLSGYSVAQGGKSFLTYDATLAVSGGSCSTSSRFQNSFSLSANSGSIVVTGNTPVLQFYCGGQYPTIDEVP